MFNIDYDESDILYNEIKVYDPSDGDIKKKNLQLNFTVEDLDTFCLYVANLD